MPLKNEMGFGGVFHQGHRPYPEGIASFSPGLARREPTLGTSDKTPATLKELHQGRAWCRHVHIISIDSTLSELTLPGGRTRGRLATSQPRAGIWNSVGIPVPRPVMETDRCGMEPRRWRWMPPKRLASSPPRARASRSLLRNSRRPWIAPTRRLRPECKAAAGFRFCPRRRGVLE